MKTQVERLQRHWREVDQLIKSGRIDGEEEWPEWKLEQADKEFAQELQRQFGWTVEELAAVHVIGDRAAKAFVEEHLAATAEDLKQQVVEWIFGLFTQTYLTAWSAAEERMAYRGRWVG